MIAYADFALAVPELILSLGALGLLMVGAFSGKEAARTVSLLAIVLLIGAAGAVIEGGNGAAFSGAFVVDAYARFLKVLSLLGSAIAVLMSMRFARREQFESFELPVLIVLASVGMMMMISATDLITVYLGIELQSLALYVLAAMRRDNARSTEAGLKYFVLGALSSGMLLYGASLIYGFTGHTDFAGIASALADGQPASLGVTFGIVFVAAGLAFKVSVVPFHMWTPDVYEGAPTPITAFFAAAPKIAGMAVFVRIALGALDHVTHDWQQIVAFMALASMLLVAICLRLLALAFTSLGGF